MEDARHRFHWFVFYLAQDPCGGHSLHIYSFGSPHLDFLSTGPCVAGVLTEDPELVAVEVLHQSARFLTGEHNQGRLTFVGLLNLRFSSILAMRSISSLSRSKLQQSRFWVMT